MDKTLESNPNAAPYRDPITNITIRDMEKNIDSDAVVKQWDTFAFMAVSMLEEACETKNQQIIITALDCLHKLLNFGYILHGTACPIQNVGDDGYMIPFVITFIKKCLAYSNDSNVQIQIVKAITTAVSNPAVGIHGKELITAIKIIYNIFLTSTVEKTKDVAKGNLQQMFNIIVQRMDREEDVNNLTSSKDTDSVDSSIKISLNGENLVKEIVNDIVDNIVVQEDTKEPNGHKNETDSKDGKEKKHKRENGIIFSDSVIIFKVLCKVAGKEVTNSSKDILDSKKKVLSLELMYSILQQSSKAIVNNVRFIREILKKHLCMCLSVNAISPVPKVYLLSLQIFSILLINYRKYLKDEIAVIFDLYLKILESPNSSFQSKFSTTQFLHTLCKNPQILADLFLNYDCDIKGINIFGRIINAISKVAQSYQFAKDTVQHNQLRTLGLQCLVSIVGSLVDWSAELYKNSNSDVDKQPPVSTIPEEIQIMKEKKNIVEKGVSLFNINPFKGIKFLTDSKYIENTPQSISNFIKTNKDLKTPLIGEYIGSHKNVELLNTYIDNFHNFSGVDLDLALRSFIFDSNLPRETQQIDRVMLKFAEKYYSDNAGTPHFVNADSVYCLSFAIIMLATDRHQVLVKDKMPLSTWKRNLLGLNDEKDFDEKLLDSMFDRICLEPLKTRDGELMPRGRNEQINLQLESELLAIQAQESLKAVLNNKDNFFKESNIEYVRPMFEVGWCPFLAAFSICLEDSNDADIISLCLQGFKFAIRLSSVFYLDIERDAFVTALSKFTSLENLRKMTEKHIQCIKTLIDIAITDGNYLRDSWKLVIKCISQLERMILLGSGSRIDDSLGEDKDPKFNTLLEENSSTIASNLKGFDIDKIFTDSVKLDNQSILDLVKSLCAASKDELNMNNPRIFCMQKVVEIASFNMENRIKIVWTKIWLTLAEHFTFAGAHKNKKVAIFAIDSLRQLSMKFMEIDELSSFHFQQQFLKPFEIIACSKSKKVRGYALENISVMVKKFASNIKSGWTCILNVLSQEALIPDNTSLLTLAFTIIEFIFYEAFNHFKDTFFVNFVNTLTNYSTSELVGEQFSKMALALIQACGNKLLRGEVVPSTEIFSSQNREIWSPILSGLTLTILNSNSEVSEKAMSILFKSILNDNKDMFDLDFWSFTFNIILSIFEEKKESIHPHSYQALEHMTEIFVNNFEKISSLLKEILQLIVSSLISGKDIQSSKGRSSIDNLITKLGDKFNSEQWDLILNDLGGAINHINSQLSKLEAEKEKIELKSFQNFSENNIFLLNLIKNKILNNNETVNSNHIKKIIGHNIENYMLLSKLTLLNNINDYMNMMLDMENSSISFFLFIIETYNSKFPDIDCDNLFLSAFKYVIDNYLKYCDKDSTSKHKKIIVTKTNVLSQFLDILQKFDENKMKEHSLFIYNLLCEITLCDSQNIRKKARTLLISFGKKMIGENHNNNQYQFSI